MTTTSYDQLVKERFDLFHTQPRPYDFEAQVRRLDEKLRTIRAARQAEAAAIEADLNPEPLPRTGIPTVTLRIPGKVMSTMEGSELTSNPRNYDGGTVGAWEAYRALQVAQGRRAGRGWTYTIETSRDGAAVIGDYCRTVGETFTGGGVDDPDARAEGRALLVVADRIAEALR